MSNLYCLLITQNREKDIRELLSNLYPTFDGIIACVHQPILDDTYSLLKESQGKGRILIRDFFPYHHSHSMNELFYCRHLKNNDKILILDSPERASNLLISEIKNIFNWMDKNDISMIYGDGRPYLISYEREMFFHSNPHWDISGFSKKITSWTKEQKNSYIINTRHNNPAQSYCLNPIKYQFCYHAENNELYSTYSKFGDKIYADYYLMVKEFKNYCENILSLNLNTLEDLINYLKRIESKEITPEEYFLDFMEKDFRLSELYQLQVLNYDFMGNRPENPIGMHPRFKWNIREHLKTGNGWNNPDFKNLVLQYEQKIKP